MKKIPLFGSSLEGFSSVVSAQKRLNCFVDKRTDGDQNTAVMLGTPGLTLSWVLPTGPVRGWHVVNNVLYVVGGNVLYSIQSNGVITALGTLSSATTTSFVGMADNGVQLGLADGTYVYCYTLVTGTYYQTALNAAGSFGIVTDANCPRATSLTFLDGRVIANKPSTRQAYVCEYYDLTAWTNYSGLPTYMTKENSSDNLLAVDMLNGTLYLWGIQSLEFWQDVGSSPNPFSRITGTSQNWGLAAIYSRQPIGGTFIFLAQNPQGSLQIVMLNGYTPVKISTSDIDYVINTFTTWSDATSLTYSVAGHLMYQINFPSANISFLYDQTTSLWQTVQTGLGLTGRHIANSGSAFGADNYVADSTTPNIYLVDPSAYTENGAPVKRQLVSRHVEADGNDFSIAELYMDMETGVGLQSGQGANPEIVLEVSKDQGRTFGPERRAKLGAVGQYRSPRAVWRRLGRARDFVFRFTVTDPIKFVFVRASIVVSEPQEEKPYA